MLVLGCGTSTLPLDLAVDSFAVTATDIAPAAITRMRARAAELVPVFACMALKFWEQAALCVCVWQSARSKNRDNEHTSCCKA